ncbi:MAG: hypothetical protein JWO72_1051, partial [Caulobacteraceae bacterium]|nr:hypothetical protein [Caulobacteraceae bacterium]
MAATDFAAMPGVAASDGDIAKRAYGKVM